MDYLLWILVVIIAFLVGKLFTKIKMPAILGWLITGMVLGPYALNLLKNELMVGEAYNLIIHILECTVGLMIGTELVWKKIKKSGRAIIITTLFQSLGTFLVVSLVFMVTFLIVDIPLFLAFIFGGIALATAPAPSLSIVREFKTDGPVTRTLIPMAALDDIVGVVVFFTTISIISGTKSNESMPWYLILGVILLPLIIGAAVGLLTGLVLRKSKNINISLMVVIIGILVASGIGFIFNEFLLPAALLNFMLIGMSFSAAFANMVGEEELETLMTRFNPILGVSLIVVILNLGAPLDYHAILGAGLFTVIYIISRAFGKYFGAFTGAALTKSPRTVRNYLGLTLLPHSGVSLVFTGIAVGTLNNIDPSLSTIVNGTIAAAAIINEIIAVIVARKAFSMAGELNKGAIKDGENIQSS